MRASSWRASCSPSVTPVYLSGALERALTVAQQAPTLISGPAVGGYEALEDAERLKTTAEVQRAAADLDEIARRALETRQIGFGKRASPPGASWLGLKRRLRTWMLPYTKRRRAMHATLLPRRRRRAAESTAAKRAKRKQKARKERARRNRRHTESRRTRSEGRRICTNARTLFAWPGRVRHRDHYFIAGERRCGLLEPFRSGCFHVRL